VPHLDMKIAGHTMATPGVSVFDALERFARLGLSGLEAVAMRRDEAARSYERTGRDPAEMLAAEGEPFSTDWPEPMRRDLRMRAGRLIPVVTVTPYVRALNHPDPAVRAQAVSQMQAYVDLAGDVGASFVRVYGGEDRSEPGAWDLLVDSLRTLAEYAAAEGIVLLLENHPGTMTVTGRATAEVVRAVDSACLRVLYDPANVLAHSDEPPRGTFEVQRDMIGYVHVKDLQIGSGRKPRACLLGDGSVPWAEILRWLSEAGYDGWFSLEYEKKWAPQDLPDAEVGLAACRDFLLQHWPGPRSGAG